MAGVLLSCGCNERLARQRLTGLLMVGLGDGMPEDGGVYRATLST
jgi:hypothetical protein